MHCMCGWGHALQRYTLQCDLNNLIYALVFSFNNENCSRGKNCGEDQIIRLKQVFKSDLKDAIFFNSQIHNVSGYTNKLHSSVFKSFLTF